MFVFTASFQGINAYPLTADYHQLQLPEGHMLVVIYQLLCTRVVESLLHCASTEVFTNKVHAATHATRLRAACVKFVNVRNKDHSTKAEKFGITLHSLEKNCAR